ncbi:MAG: FtsH protease activity modulator HflK [Oscillospiraceae bacterium]|jgi:membrane protease subunit HflK|nr:FtsH protease activity modulator HflK [Oscillospiraceae bacterium]
MEFQNPFRRKDGSQPPDKAKIAKRARRYAAVIAAVIIAAVLAFNSLYTLNNGEQAVITRWGKYQNTVTASGLQFKLPFADRAHIVNVDQVRSMSFGAILQSDGTYADIVAESLMLTQEENLVNADWVIQYRISNSYNWLFKLDNPEATLHSVTQSAYRRVTAGHPLDDILTNRKDDMQREVLSELQGICDKYEMGIEIIAIQLQDAAPPEEVRLAFLDVTQAIEDKNTTINQARTYANEKLPMARGEAAAAANQAAGYKEQRINEAVGAVARYKAIEQEYRNQPDIMRTRLYLEMIREVLPEIANVYFVDPSSGNLLEILQLAPNAAQPAAPAQTTPTPPPAQENATGGASE